MSVPMTRAVTGAVTTPVAQTMRATSHQVAQALLHLDNEAIDSLDALRQIDAGIIAPEDLEDRVTAPVRALAEAVLRIRDLSKVDAPVNVRHKLIVAATPDARAILVALVLRAERLRSLTVSGDGEPDQALGRETLEMHAPLAHRLGLTVLKSELEEAAFRISDPIDYAKTADVLSSVPGSDHADVERSADALRVLLNRVGLLEVEVTGRRKSLHSLHRKLASGRGMNEVMDLIGLRVVCTSVDECYVALAEIHHEWEQVPGRFKDFIAVPTENGYRSIHTTVRLGAGPVEIQIRTEEMHLQAEWGVAAHWLYKDGSRASIDADASATQAPNDPIEALAQLRSELVGDEVFAITPVGRLLQLPPGATPVDFAYAIHTEIGHRCQLAKVNGKLHRLNAPLPTVAEVEIVTGDRAGPSREWLTSVKTGRARSKIRAWFHAREEREHKRVGVEAFHKALSAEKLDPVDADVASVIGRTAVDLGFKNADELAIGIGSGAIPTGRAVRLVLRSMADRGDTEPRVEAQTTDRQRSTPARQRRDGGEVQVASGGVLLPARLARCCSPLPGQRITGYLSSMRGLVAHRRGCPELALAPGGSERQLSIAWPIGAAASVEATLIVHLTESAPGNERRAIEEVVGSSGSELVELSETTDLTRLRLVVTLEAAPQLHTLMQRIMKLPGVRSVRRP